MVLDRRYSIQSITGRLAECSLDELRVLSRVLDGVELGRDSYGPLDIASDSRIWNNEIEQELRDCLFYMAAHFVAEEDIKREQRQAEYDRAINAGLDELTEAEPITAPRPVIDFDLGGEE